MWLNFKIFLEGADEGTHRDMFASVMRGYGIGKFSGLVSALSMEDLHKKTLQTIMKAATFLKSDKMLEFSAESAYEMVKVYRNYDYHDFADLISLIDSENAKYYKGMKKENIPIYLAAESIIEILRIFISYFDERSWKMALSKSLAFLNGIGIQSGKPSDIGMDLF